MLNFPPSYLLFFCLFVLTQNGPKELPGTSMLNIAYLKCGDFNFYHLIQNEKEKASKSHLDHFLPSQRKQSYTMHLCQLSSRLIMKPLANGYSITSL